MYRWMVFFLGLSISVAAAALPQTEHALATIAQDVKRPLVDRAAALAALRDYPGPNALIAIARGSQSDASQLRLAALRGAEGLSPKLQLEVALPLTADPVAEVRLEAARLLVPLWLRLPPEVQQLITPAVEAYVSTLEQQPVSAAILTQIGDVYRYRGQFNQAESHYQQAIQDEKGYVPAYLNLADLYRQQQREDLGVETLHEALVVNPQSADAHYSLGLAYHRQQQAEQAVDHLRRAYQLDPHNSQHTFVYAAAIQQQQPEKASGLFREAYQASANPQYLYALCDHLITQGDPAAAACVDDLAAQVPGQVVETLRQRLTQP